MRRVLILGALGTFLAGCAGVYDEGALPSASAARELAIEQCGAQIGGGAFHSVAEAMECQLAADRAFSVAIKLKKMDLYDAYAARVRLLAQQADAKQIPSAQLIERLPIDRREFGEQVDQAARIDAEQRARMAAAFAAAGAAMERQADRDAYVAAHNSSLNCTSTAFGGTVNTRCN